MFDHVNGACSGAGPACRHKPCWPMAARACAAYDSTVNTMSSASLSRCSDQRRKKKTMSYKTDRRCWGIVLSVTLPLRLTLSGGLIWSKRVSVSEVGGTRGGQSASLQCDSPETRPTALAVAAAASSSTPLARWTVASSRPVCGPSAAAPVCAARRSMFNNEPTGHTGSFVRRRVSHTTRVVFFLSVKNTDVLFAFTHYLAMDAFPAQRVRVLQLQPR